MRVFRRMFMSPAEREEADENWLTAAQLWERAGNHSRAADMYWHAHLPEEAFQCLLRIRPPRGLVNRIVDAFRHQWITYVEGDVLDGLQQAGELPELVSQVSGQVDQLPSYSVRGLAADLTKRGHPSLGARLYLSLGQRQLRNHDEDAWDLFSESAKAYARDGDFERAIEAFRMSMQPGGPARCSFSMKLPELLTVMSEKGMAGRLVQELDAEWFTTGMLDHLALFDWIRDHIHDSRKKWLPVLEGYDQLLRRASRVDPEFQFGRHYIAVLWKRAGNHAFASEWGYEPSLDHFCPPNDAG